MKAEFYKYNRKAILIQALYRGNIAREKTKIIKECIEITTSKKVDDLLKKSREKIGILQMHV